MFNKNFHFACMFINAFIMGADFIAFFEECDTKWVLYFVIATVAFLCNLHSFREADK